MYPLVIRHLNIQPYIPVWKAMQQLTSQRNSTTPNEIWFLQHHPVFTLGLNGKTEFIYQPGNIPIVNIDRGGQVTYHGPGQLVAYLLIDLKRQALGVRQLITLMETAIIQLLANLSIQATAKPEAPGVYVDESKIAAVGLRIRRGCSYHGLSLNIDMDLSPFQRIAPCGYPQLKITQLKTLGITASFASIQSSLQTLLIEALAPSCPVDLSVKQALPKLHASL